MYDHKRYWDDPQDRNSQRIYNQWKKIHSALCDHLLSHKIQHSTPTLRPRLGVDTSTPLYVNSMLLRSISDKLEWFSTTSFWNFLGFSLGFIFRGCGALGSWQGWNIRSAIDPDFNLTFMVYRNCISGGFSDSGVYKPGCHNNCSASPALARFEG